MLSAAFRATGRPIFPGILRPRRKVCVNIGLSCKPFHTSGIFTGIKGLPKGTYEFPESHADFETSTAEWEFVERLMAPKHIPEPNHLPGTVTPSGWVAPSAKRGSYPYFVMRNANYLLRIYKDVDPINQSVKTSLKGIEGDIFALGKELYSYLLELSGKRHVSVRVHEPHGVIIVKGDFPEPIREFLVRKGF